MNIRERARQILGPYLWQELEELDSPDLWRALEELEDIENPDLFRAMFYARLPDSILSNVTIELPPSVLDNLGSMVGIDAPVRTTEALRLTPHTLSATPLGANDLRTLEMSLRMIYPDEEGDTRALLQRFVTERRAERDDHNRIMVAPSGTRWETFITANLRATDAQIIAAGFGPLSEGWQRFRREYPQMTAQDLALQVNALQLPDIGDDLGDRPYSVRHLSMVYASMGRLVSDATLRHYARYDYLSGSSTEHDYAGAYAAHLLRNRGVSVLTSAEFQELRSYEYIMSQGEPSHARLLTTDDLAERRSDALEDRLLLARTINELAYGRRLNPFTQAELDEIDLAERENRDPRVPEYNLPEISRFERRTLERALNLLSESHDIATPFANIRGTADRAQVFAAIYRIGIQEGLEGRHAAVQQYGQPNPQDTALIRRIEEIAFRPDMGDENLNRVGFHRLRELTRDHALEDLMPADKFRLEMAIDLLARNNGMVSPIPLGEVDGEYEEADIQEDLRLLLENSRIRGLIEGRPGLYYTMTVEEPVERISKTPREQPNRGFFATANADEGDTHEEQPSTRTREVVAFLPDETYYNRLQRNVTHISPVEAGSRYTSGFGTREGGQRVSSYHLGHDFGQLRTYYLRDTQTGLVRVSAYSRDITSDPRYIEDITRWPDNITIRDARGIERVLPDTQENRQTIQEAIDGDLRVTRESHPNRRFVLHAENLETRVRASADGVVVAAIRNHRDFGNCMVLRHADGTYSFYAHLQSFAPDVVPQGQFRRVGGMQVFYNAAAADFPQRTAWPSVEPPHFVEAGQNIGIMGNTGRGVGTHLHYAQMTHLNLGDLQRGTILGTERTPIYDISDNMNVNNGITVDEEGDGTILIGDRVPANLEPDQHRSLTERYIFEQFLERAVNDPNYDAIRGLIRASFEQQGLEWEHVEEHDGPTPGPERTDRELQQRQ